MCAEKLILPFLFFTTSKLWNQQRSRQFWHTRTHTHEHAHARARTHTHTHLYRLNCSLPRLTCR